MTLPLSTLEVEVRRLAEFRQDLAEDVW